MDATRYTLTVSGTGDSLKFPGAFLEEIQFGDGTVWTLDDLVSRDPYSEMNRSTGVTITGSASGETLRAFAGNDALYGGQGNDDMYGFEGDDYLVGGGGVDWLRGGPGADTYFFEAGDGRDNIVEDRDLSFNGGQSRPDVIEFGTTVAAANITVSFVDSGFGAKNLLLRNSSTGDLVTVWNWFGLSGVDGTLEVRFADGITWTTEDLKLLASVNNATDGNDFLVGSGRVDVLGGRIGDDTLRALAGDDYISGGPGNDRLEGGIGNDTYYFAAGDGVDLIVDEGGDFDSIVLGTGIDPRDVTITENGGDLEIRIAGTGDTITIYGQLARSGSRIETLMFSADGSSIDLVSNPFGGVVLTESNPDFDGTYYDDTIHGTEGNNYIRGGVGNDRLLGLGGRDQISGGEGDDFLDGGTGNDDMWGGGGTNTFFFDVGYGSDNIYDPGDGAIIRLGPGIDVSNIRLYAISGANLQIGVETNADDRLTLVGWFGGLSHDGSPGTIRFNDGTEWGLEEIEARIDRSGTPGDDILVGRLDDSGDMLDGGDGDDSIFGKGGNDILMGGEGSDVLYGGVGNDELHPGVTGNDELYGGEGADNYVFGHDFGRVSIHEDFTDISSNKITFTSEIAPEDVYVFVANPNFADTLDVKDLYIQVKNTGNWITVHDWKFGSDRRLIDTIVFEADGTEWNTADIENQARFNLINLNSLPGENLDTGPFYAPRIVGERGLEQGESIEGTSGNDVIDAGRGDDVVYGFDGDDRLLGGSGDDWIYASAGDDYIEGGRGNDLLVGGIGADTYYVDLDSGVDKIIDFDAAPGRVDRILFADEIIATDLEFSKDENNLYINIGNYRAFLTLPWYVHEAYQLEAFVIGGRQYALEAFRLPSSGPVTVEGTAFGDFLLGSDQDDLMRGHEGGDLLNGGPGADRMEGGAGDDVYYVDDPGDTVTDTSGNDTVYSTIGYTLGAGLENLVMQNQTRGSLYAYGNELNNEMRAGGGGVFFYAGQGDDMLEGGFSEVMPGAWDYLYGQDGNDTIRIHDRAGVAWGGDGMDAIYGGSSAWNYLFGEGGDDFIQAGAGNALLFGGYGNDTLRGGAGNDVLYGNQGNDDMAGGAGDDAYYVTDPGDVVTEAVDEGIDRVISSIDYTLGANVENLTYTDSAAHVAYGNELDNEIRGGQGNLTAYGGDGDDTLLAGAAQTPTTGWDVFYGENGNDTIRLNIRNGGAIGGAGNDSLYGGSGSLNYLGGDAGDDYLEAGSGYAYMVGGSGQDTLVGGAAGDYMDGGRGADVMSGGLGNDTFLVDDIGDQVTENPGEGIDQVQSSVDFVLGANVENLTLTGAAELRGEGNGLDNVLIARNAGNAYLYGKDGNDTLRSLTAPGAGTTATWDYFYAGNGDDALYLGARNGAAFGEAGNDLLVGGSGFGALFGGSGNDRLVGSAGTVYLDAGAGDDVIESGSSYETIAGGAGNDVYVFGRGDAGDMINDFDYMDSQPAQYGATTDILQFESGIDHDQLWFSQVGSNLQVNVIGTSDSVTVSNWYLGAAYQLDYMDAGDGLRLYANQVDQLVQAMAAFSPPAAGELDLSPQLQTALAPTLAASWQTAV